MRVRKESANNSFHTSHFSGGWLAIVEGWMFSLWQDKPSRCAHLAAEQRELSGIGEREKQEYRIFLYFQR